VDKVKAGQLHDELLAGMPEGARHDADICSFCVDKAAQEAPVPSGPEAIKDPEGTEGGTTKAMADDTKQDVISQETHVALMEKALKDATSVTTEALERKTQENAELTTKVETLTAENESLKSDNARVNKELDEAQISLKTAVDEAAVLKQEKADAAAATEKAELAAKRADQVKALGVFPEEFVTEKAARWAELADADWAERVEEWAARRPEATPNTETASALSGTTGELTKEHTDTASEPQTSRRAVLGL
jgi:regulator of replication initiation timing